MKTISADEYKKQYGEQSYNQIGGSSAKTKSPSIWDRIKQTVQQTANKNIDITKGTGEYAGQGNIRRGFELAGNTARGIFDTAVGVPVQATGEALGGTKTMQNLVTNHPNTAAHIENVARPLADPVGSAGNQLGKSNFFQEAAGGIDQNPNSFAGKTESGLSILKNTGDVANLILAPEFAKDTANVLKNRGGQLLSKIPTPKIEKPNLTDLKTKATDYYGKQIKTDWERPTQTPNASYDKATKIYAKAKSQGHDIGDTLIKNKIDPQMVTEGGKYQTTDTSAKLKMDANKTSHDLLRPSLEQADNFTPRTPVEEVIKTAAKRINQNTKLTPGMKETLIGKLQVEYKALKTKYPEGMKLVDLHDNKITYDDNANYSPVGDIATNNVARINKALADANRILLEGNAPKDIPVEQFNAELTKQNQAANYLDALNNKKVPITLKSRIANTTAKVIGAAGGNALGGGILGGVGGYHIGGMVESLIENMPNPFREQFLNNLKTSNPEAFSKVSDFLQQQTSDQFTRKALPESTTIYGQPRTPAESKMEVLPAEKQIYRDSKTGQMQRGYKSVPQTGETKIGGKIPRDDLNVMADFTDYVAGAYKPSSVEMQRLELDASRIAERYGLKKAKTLQGLANKFGYILEEEGFKR